MALLAAWRLADSYLKDMGSATSLLDTPPRILNPEGFEYYEEIVNEQEEAALLAYFELLEYEPFIMRGQPSRRRIARFGHDYGSAGRAGPAARRHQRRCHRRRFPRG